MLPISNIIYCWAASGRRNRLSSLLSLDHWLKSLLGISSKTQWNQWESHYSIPRYTRKDWQKLLGKNLNFHRLVWKCAELSFKWNKGRNFIMVWSFHISFQYLFWGDLYSCRFTSCILSLGRKGRHGLGMNTPRTLKIRFHVKIGNQPFFCCFSFYNEKNQDYIYGSGSFFPLKEKVE